jgi:hypothetical protein
VASLSETHLKPPEKFFIPNCHFYRTDRFPGRKGGIAVAVRKGIPRKHVRLPSLVSIVATGVHVRNSNSELILAAAYKSSGHACNGIDIPEF